VRACSDIDEIESSCKTELEPLPPVAFSSLPLSKPKAIKSYLTHPHGRNSSCATRGCLVKLLVGRSIPRVVPKIPKKGFGESWHPIKRVG
jgi:hypothetical protein